MVSTIEGTIVDATMNTVSIITPDGQVLAFATDGVTVESENGLFLDAAIKINYQGALESTSVVQNVTIQSIEVLPSSPAQSQVPIETAVVETIAPSPVVTPTPQPTQTPEPTPEVDPITLRAQQILETMSIEEKIGQMFIARCPEQQAAQKVSEYHVGGYILFGRDFTNKTYDEVVVNIQSYQEQSTIPLFIGVDEEGGSVNRVSTNPNLRAVPFWSPQRLYANGGFDLIISDTQEKDTLLHSLGINLNFAPVCDVSNNPDDFIYDRSFGQDASATSEFVRTVVSTMANDAMGSVLKHFPGYGNNVDTHTGIAYDTRPYETFVNSDFLPFQAGIEADASMVLVSHNVVESMDGSYPASLSPIVHQILREQLGFDGVIITDDLAMHGVRDYVSEDQLDILAILAGNDLLCCTDFEAQIGYIIDAYYNGTISQQPIDQSVMRILELKLSLGLLQ